MPSPFPGMDPFIEGQCWRDFHASIIGEIRSTLQPRLRPRYAAFIEEEVYVAKENGTPVRIVVPDVAVSLTTDWRVATGADAQIATKPTVVTLPMTETIEIPYLVIRKRDGDETIAIIAVLSPTNKSPRDGRSDYLAKRNSILRSQAHLIELDLLRGGERLPTVEPYPAGDFFAIVSRAQNRPLAELFAWTLNLTMPTIPIPLADGDPDVPLDLRDVFNRTYDRAGYDYVLKYEREIEPPVDERRNVWVRQILAK